MKEKSELFISIARSDMIENVREQKTFTETYIYVFIILTNYCDMGSFFIY